MKDKKTPKEKESYVKKIVKWIGIATLIITAGGGVILFLINYGKQQQAEIEYKKDQKDVTFEDKTQRDKAIDYVNADYTPLSVYFQNDTVKQNQDSLKVALKRNAIQQANLDTILTDIYEQRAEDMALRKIHDSVTHIENEALKEKRAEKYLLQERILHELEGINLRQADFKNELKKIKDSL